MKGKVPSLETLCTILVGKIRQTQQYILQSGIYISAQTIDRMDEPDLLHLQEPNCI